MIANTFHDTGYICRIPLRIASCIASMARVHNKSTEKIIDEVASRFPTDQAEIRDIMTKISLKFPDCDFSNDCANSICHSIDDFAYFAVPFLFARYQIGTYCMNYNCSIHNLNGNLSIDTPIFTNITGDICNISEDLSDIVKKIQGNVMPFYGYMLFRNSDDVGPEHFRALEFCRFFSELKPKIATDTNGDYVMIRNYDTESG